MSAAAWSACCASLVVSLTSFGGVLILRLNKAGDTGRLVEYMTTFASACLLGVVVFHLLPESFEKIQADKDAPHWLPGGLVLLGVAVSLLIEVQVHVWLGHDDNVDTSRSNSHGHSHDHSHGRLKLYLDGARALPTTTPTAPTSSVSSLQSPTLTDDTDASTHSDHSHRDEHNDEHCIPVEDDKLPEIASPRLPQQVIAPIAWMTAMGDFCHAFTDGIVLAVAFQSCSTALGWAVAFGVVLHEVPHRIGDFFVFLGAGMTARQASLLNLLASCGSLLGVGVIFSLGSVQETTIGAMLAIGAGSLLFIALTELLPPVLAVHDQKSAIAHICWFVLGCALLWLSALREVECEASETSTETTTT